jgi:hypothetical protein
MRYLLALGLLLLLKPAYAQQAQLEALLQRYHVPGMQLVYTKGKAVRTYHVGVREAGTSP